MKIPDKVIETVRNAQNIVALTGAGMSVESGIAPFRGKGGLWERFDPEKYAHIDAFRKDPQKSWELFRLQIEEVTHAVPHTGYHALVTLERYGLKSVITQNVDGLHKKTGSRDVVELHGTLSKLRCDDCSSRKDTLEYMDQIYNNTVPKCPCGAYFRPDVVMFGEPLPTEAMQRALELCCESDLVLVIGTSSIVYPAASLPDIARNSGAVIVEINTSKTAITGHTAHHTIYGGAETVLTRLADELR